MRFIKNVVVPVSAILLLAWLGKYIYIVDGRIDWLRFCLVFGIPFGVPYMLWVIPIGGDPAKRVALLMLNLVVGAVFGCMLAAVAFVRAIIILIVWILKPGMRA